MADGLAVLDGREGVEWRRGEEEDVAVLVAVELFADVFRDGEIRCVAEMVDFYGPRWVVCVPNGDGVPACGLREAVAALRRVRVIGVTSRLRGCKGVVRWLWCVI